MKLLKKYCMIFTPDKFSQMNTMAESDSFPWIEISTDDSDSSGKIIQSNYFMIMYLWELWLAL